MKFFNRKSLIVINISILGKKFKALIDTGSEKSFIAPNRYLNSFLKALPKKINVKGIGKAKKIEYGYFIPRMLIDHQTINEAIFLMKRKNFLFYYLGIDAILGHSVKFLV